MPDVPHGSTIYSIQLFYVDQNMIDVNSERARTIRLDFKRWVNEQKPNRPYNFESMEFCAVGMYAQEVLGLKPYTLDPNFYDVINATHWERYGVFMEASRHRDLATFGDLAFVLNKSPLFA